MKTGIFYSYDEPIILRPGDEIKTTCLFQSNRNVTVTFGLATKDEMCLAFLTYYPKENLKRSGINKVTKK